MLEQELKEVGIKGGKFHIQFNDKVISSSGIDAVSFLFSANPGEDPKPLNKVASGGELSRIMLVLKEVIARVEGGSVIIFDEADSVLREQNFNTSMEQALLASVVSVHF